MEVFSSQVIRRLPRAWRLIIAVTGAAALLVVSGATFWYQDMRYSLPTPRPKGFVDVVRGQTVALPAPLNAIKDDSRPLLLHFFNPDCPCTRFNADHLRLLRERFGSRVRFVAVAQVMDAKDPAARERGLSAAGRLFGSDMPAVVDVDGKIAETVGVYSTPQAALLAGGDNGPGRTLFFRGNYNSSRYCTDPQTEFVRIALEALVEGRKMSPSSREAMVAYGCELPANLSVARLATNY